MRKLKVSELDRKSISEFKEAEKSRFVIVLDNVRSLNNIGSIFRTADAMLAGGIYLCGITATPPHRDIHKTALGATDSVDWYYYATTKEAITILKSEGYKLIAVEQADKSIQLHDFAPIDGERYALIFGHEVKGVDQKIIDLCDSCIEIPQFGTKHSLNISVSAGIVIWEIFRKMLIR
jgi:tRNA G18 (ribose-2'-O)-methylase SpoU